jgi:16S rRNA (uracil1498-N3)-methyltransferase
VRVPRIFVSIDIQKDDCINLEEAESHYVKAVLRLKIKNEIILFNGTDYEYHGYIQEIQKKSVLISIKKQIKKNTDSPIKTRLLIAISRSNRFDMIVQKATELGISSITPIETDYSDIKIKKINLSHKLNHWQKISINACQQSGRNCLPTIEQIQSFSNAITADSSGKKIILTPGCNKTLKSIGSVKKEISIASGPEGGFSEREMTLAKNTGFDAISLGPRILRTETAPLAALSIIQSKWGDLI